MSKACAYDGCRNALEYFKNTVKEFNGRKYCSHLCLKDQFKGLREEGAIHFVHQSFGPDHPVTEQIQKMRSQLAEFRKDTDYLERICRGFEYEDRNFKKLCHDSGKCL